ncbi:DUF1737 domain-containing protein [Paremcibacter congregatus]|nr:DUF1737 domain-containing protein [Paremcibacter congregatus]
MEYLILDDFEMDSLQEKVNKYIKDGYHPVGGLATTNQKDGFVEYLQAMIKE